MLSVAIRFITNELSAFLLVPVCSLPGNLCPHCELWLLVPAFLLTFTAQLPSPLRLRLPVNILMAMRFSG